MSASLLPFPDCPPATHQRHGLELEARIQHLGWPILLEDQEAAFATYYQWLLTSGTIAPETARRYVGYIRQLCEALPSWSAAGPTTIWHLCTLGVGQEICWRWRLAFCDNEELLDRVFGDRFAALERFVREFLCNPASVLRYEAMSELGLGRPVQRGYRAITERYGTLVNPFPPVWRARRHTVRRPPVPHYDPWCGVLDYLFWGQRHWLTTLAFREGFPRVRGVAMLHLQSAAGPRPGELRLVKQAHLLRDELIIRHGAFKDRRPRGRYHADRYGNRIKRQRRVSLAYVPREIVDRVDTTWRRLLERSEFVPIEPDAPLFPSRARGGHRCVSAERHRSDHKNVLLEAANVPSLRSVFEEYRVAPRGELIDLTFRPHDVRAVYVTHRMDLCAKPGAFRALMADLGWISPVSVRHYDRPADPDEDDDDAPEVLDAVRRESRAAEATPGLSCTVEEAEEVDGADD